MLVADALLDKVVEAGGAAAEGAQRSEQTGAYAAILVCFCPGSPRKVHGTCCMKVVPQTPSATHMPCAHAAAIRGCKGSCSQVVLRYPTSLPSLALAMSPPSPPRTARTRLQCTMLRSVSRCKAASQALATVDVQLLQPVEATASGAQSRTGSRTSSSPRALADTFKFIDTLRLHLRGAAEELTKLAQRAAARDAAASDALVALQLRTQAVLHTLALLLHDCREQELLLRDNVTSQLMDDLHKLVSCNMGNPALLEATCKAIARLALCSPEVADSLLEFCEKLYNGGDTGGLCRLAPDLQPVRVCSCFVCGLWRLPFVLLVCKNAPHEHMQYQRSLPAGLCKGQPLQMCILHPLQQSGTYGWHAGLARLCQVRASVPAVPQSALPPAAPHVATPRPRLRLRPGLPGAGPRGRQRRSTAGAAPRRLPVRHRDGAGSAAGGAAGRVHLWAEPAHAGFPAGSGAAHCGRAPPHCTPQPSCWRPA